MTATATTDEIVGLRPSTSPGFSLAGVIDNVLQLVYNLPGASLVQQQTGVTTDPNVGTDHAA